MKILQYIRLHVKKVQRRLRIITPFTFLDMRTLHIRNICLQTYRNNRMRLKSSLLLKKNTNFTCE